MKRTAKQKKRDSKKSTVEKVAAGQGSHAPIQVLRGSLDGSKIKIGVVTARFNSEITEKLEDGALRTLRSLGVAPKNIRRVSVPGAVEIVVAAKALLKSGVDAVVALGCVVRGETTHYDSVVGVVDRGCTHLQLKTGRPVVFGVITTENFDQAEARVGGSHGHKGEEAAEVAVEMVNLLKHPGFKK